jgi:hypothetical protein
MGRIYRDPWVNFTRLLSTKVRQTLHFDVIDDCLGLR